MSLILTRSPYFVGKGQRSDASLLLEIGTVSGGSFSVSKTYSFAYRSGDMIDISPFINDYLGSSYFFFPVFNRYVASTTNIGYVRYTVSGTGEADVTISGFATNGYLFSAENDKYKTLSGDAVYNLDSLLQDNCYVANSTNLIYKLDDSNIRFNILKTDVSLLDSPSSSSIDISFLNKGDVIRSQSLTFSHTSSSESLVRVDSSEYSSFKERIKEDDGTLEESRCLLSFTNEFKLEDFDQILISTDSKSKYLTVKTVEECKHKPYRVTFKNRFGVNEDLWFFKRSDTSINVNNQKFRGNSIGSYTARDGIKTINNFNTNGTERITLNSGFVEEEMNEAFRQLLLSEEVTLYDYKENKTYNVNLGTSELQYKQHVNDKLINYTIEFEFAHEVINNVG